MGFKKALIVVKIVMPLLFLGMGLFIVLNPEKLGQAQGANHVLGYLLLGYAVFRGFRVWQELKSHNAE